MILKNKQVLITAGPTWVAIDKVRVISNIATGRTGILLAEKLQSQAAKVTLLLGPVGVCCLNKKIRLIRFKFFSELKEKLLKELKTKKYDILIHSAAVSDFRPVQQAKGKLSSLKPHNLKLTILPKIVRTIRKLAPAAKLVIFKLESGIPDAALLKRARESLKRHKACLVVANRIHPRYKAFIVGENRIYSQSGSKEKLAVELVKLLKRGRYGL